MCQAPELVQRLVALPAALVSKPSDQTIVWARPGIQASNRTGHKQVNMFLKRFIHLGGTRDNVRSATTLPLQCDALVDFEFSSIIFCASASAALCWAVAESTGGAMASAAGTAGKAGGARGGGGTALGGARGATRGGD